VKGSTSWKGLYDSVKQYEKLYVENYQRTYSWTEEQIDEFFQDLILCVDEPGKEHFFGTLILHANEKDKKASVVDGQQRLTTVFILVAYLRDKVLELSNVSSNRSIIVTHKIYEFLRYDEQQEDEWRFESISYLRKYFMDHVYPIKSCQQKVSLKEKGNTLKFRDTLYIRKAIRYIRKIVDESLKNLSEEQVLDRVAAIVDCLRDRFYVLCIWTDSMDESLELFLTLNNRGLPLEPHDLIKGDLMRVIGEGLPEEKQKELQQDILDEWNTFSSYIPDVTVFMRHYLLSIDNHTVQKRLVHQMFMKQIQDSSDRNVNLESVRIRADEVWADLVQASIVYGKIVTGTLEGETAYNVHLMETALRSHRVALLTILRTFEETPERSELIRLLCVLSFRWIMASKNAQQLENTFQNLSTQIRTECTIDDVISSARTLINGISVDVESYFSESEDGPEARALLYAIARNQSDNQLNLDLKDPSIELDYIAPVSQSSSWTSAIISGESGDIDYVKTVSVIGNVTLVDLDKKMFKKYQNKPFIEKATLLRTSKLSITSDLAEFDSWNAQLITYRTEWLCEAFEKLFGVEKFDGQIESFYDYYLERVTS
jgi:uncharacterized protein with ParB-like and HNH nuclease domain